MASVAPLPANGQVVMGTCGWSSSDAPWAKPPTGSTAAEKLRMYSGPGIGFGCVEVDTTTYQIVDPAHVEKWCAATPPGFMFCFKMFGFICAKGGQLGGQFPRDIQEMLPIPLAVAPKGTRIELQQVPNNVVDEIWQRFHQSIEPARVAGKLGPVLFQFHLGFSPGEASRAHVEWCRARLGTTIRMAVEFRDRAWVEGPQLGGTVQWLRKLDIALVASDDLQHELTGDSSSNERVRLPLIARVATPLFGFARVHRRTGCERLLDGNEIAEWASLLRRMRNGGPAPTAGAPWVGDEPDPALVGPIFFLWGTDHKDQCVENAQSLQEALGDQSFDWKQYLKHVHANAKGGLAGFLAKGRQQQDARQRTSDDGHKSDQHGWRRSKSQREQQVGMATHLKGGERRDRRTTDVGTGGAMPTDTTQETRSCGDHKEQKTATVASCGGASSFRSDESTEQGGASHQESGPGTSISTAPRGTTSHISASSSSRPSSAPIIVPPAREAAFLKQQERASETERTVDPAVFRNLPREIRAELVNGWWNARPDVIAARKWATEMAEQDQQHRQHHKVREPAKSAGSGGSRKRGRRGSDVGMGTTQGRSIRDFMS